MVPDNKRLSGRVEGNIVSIEEKLLRTRFVVDSGNPHIVIDKKKCEGCMEKPCVYICPVRCYQKETDSISFSWENCVECGSCRIICPEDSIDWNYPRGGYGVCYRYG